MPLKSYSNHYGPMNAFASNSRLFHLTIFTYSVAGVGKGRRAPPTYCISKINCSLPACYIECTKWHLGILLRLS